MEVDIMKLPYDILTKNYVKPQLFLCETDKKRICALDTIELSGTFKVNAYSELNFTLSRTFTNMITGETQVNPFYDKVEALRLVELEGFGFFEIQDPEISTDGIREVKEVTAYSLEYRLSQKYLENFKINTGEVDSVEVMVAGSNSIDIEPVRLVNIEKPELSLTNLALEKIYDWSWGHIDDSLTTMSRQFDISRASVYDFITQDLCEKFNCYAIFDTIDNKIYLRAEELISKHIVNDKTKDTKRFELSSPYSSISYVSVNGYKTTRYKYEIKVDEYSHEESIVAIVFNDDYELSIGDNIEIADGSQESYRTDVYVTFDNLAQECNVSYSAEDIKTVLTVKGAEDLDIREVNMGLPYIVDLSYYHSIDWMGEDLYKAYTAYVSTLSKSQQDYEDRSEKMLEIKGRITYETNRLSLQYSEANSVNSTTVGTYYVRLGSDESGYYYKEVQLPDEYNATVRYYMLNGADLNEDKFSDLYAALQTYFVSGEDKDVKKLEDEKFKESFSFVDTDLETLIASLKNGTSPDEAILTFFDVIFYQLGKVPLKELYLKPYQEVEKTNVEEGWNDEANDNYWRYYPVTLVLKAVQTEVDQRQEVIDSYQAEYDLLEEKNAQIAQDASIYNNFTHDQLVRLSPFLREDEYTDDNFVETDSDTIESLMKTKHELLECGKIELAKLCAPKLEFSMDMANIYALIEFEPIIDQFQLGNFINVAIRPDYIKKARLLEVEINFDDFSDFNCSFGELTSLKTQSSIHADLLANAIAAGSSVASNQSYWEKGADLATSTDITIHNGLLDAISGIYNADKSVLIDNHGILLRQVLDNGEYSPYQIWLKNNNILVSTDAFDTAQTGIGVFEVNGRELYGVLAKAVLAGYIEGSDIVGGTININDTFMVDMYGNVTMKAASIEGYVEKDGVISSINQSAETVMIDAPRISLSGKKIDLTSDNITIDSTNFSVTKDGKITAKSGEIAGWNIEKDYLIKELTKNNIDYQMYLQAPNGDSALNAFAVRKKNSQSTDWDVQFLVDYQGRLVSQNAYILGTIHATSGSIAGYNIGPGGCYQNALYQRVTGFDTDYEVGFKATSGNEDLSFYVKQSTDNWKTSSNVFYVNNNGKLYAQNADISGKITASSGTIGGWIIGKSKIYGTSDTGNVAVMQLPTSSSTYVFAAGGSSHESYSDCPFRVSKDGKLYASKGSIGGFEIEDKSLRSEIKLYATKYQTFIQAADGTNTITAFAVRHSVDNGETWTYPFRVNYDGSAIMTNAIITGSSKINAACIENLHADYITAGVISADRIPNISASKITSGTISTDRLSSSVITTDNFSSKTLSTGRLSVTSGGNIGIWTVNSNNYLYAISGNYGVSLSATSVSHGQGGSTTWVNIVKAGQNASDKRLKKNIVAFDDKLNRIFDNLKPVQFEYSKDFLGSGIHFGYIAQDVVKSIEDEGNNINDYSFIYETEIEDNSTEKYYQLNQTDFIALNTWQIQKLKARVEELEKKLDALERNDTK